MKNKRMATTTDKPVSNTTNEEKFVDNREIGITVSGELIRLPERFAAVNKMIMRDLNGTNATPSFYLYTKDEVVSFLKNPYRYEKQLRRAVTYLYGASSHFRRLVQYFVSLSDLSYIVSPYKIDTSTAKVSSVRRNYRKVLNLLSSMDIKKQFANIITVCVREDTFFGTMWETADSIIIQQLPPEYCATTVIEDNVLNVTFDFSYFTSNQQMLALYPDEFRTKYEIYKKDANLRWQELAAPNSFAIKANSDILNYSIPPFAGILREIYDIEDYKSLKLTKTELENYAMLVMTLGIDDNGNWQMDLNKAKEFWKNLDDVLPEEIGSVLTPMPINKISFEKTHAGEADTIAEAEQNLFTAAGVSSLLFNNEKASSNALLLSIKADQAITYGIVKSLEAMLNRFVHRHSFGKNFKVTFLDCSPFNRKEVGDAYLKACQYGLPYISYYAASQGMSQDEVDCMNFLEDDVLGYKSRFKPLQSSATQSSSDSDGAGRSKKDVGDMSDETETSRERDES